MAGISCLMFIFLLVQISSSRSKNTHMCSGSYKYKFEVNGVEVIEPSKPIAGKESDSLEPVVGPFNWLTISEAQFVVRQFSPASPHTIGHYGLYIPPQYISNQEKHWP